MAGMEGVDWRGPWREVCLECWAEDTDLPMRGLKVSSESKAGYQRI